MEFDELFVSPDVGNDFSADILTRLFGGIIPRLHGSGDDTIVVGNWLETIFTVFNAFCLLAMLVVLTFTIYSMIFDTAADGKTFGQSADTKYTVLRTIFGVVGFVPIVGGFSLIQVAVLWLVSQGSAFADVTWRNVADDMLNGTPLTSGSFARIPPDSDRLVQQFGGAFDALATGHIVPAQAIINYASELEWCSPIKVKRFKVSAKRKSPVTRAWVEEFAAQAVADELHHLAALCFFMFGTGARRGEACALKWSDVKLFQKTAVINQTKVEHQRIAHLSPPVVGALANIPSNRNPEGFVFSYTSGESVGQVWRNVIKRAGIEKLSPHCCRHGFATSMLQAGVDPKTVAVRGGWKDVATVMKYYAHAMDDPTVTDVLFGTNLTQDKNRSIVSI